MTLLDRIIATNFWTAFLFLLNLFFYSLQSHFVGTSKYLFLVISFGAILVFLRVFFRQKERLRLFDIFSERIKKHGYKKEVFKGKVPSVCSLTIAVYILARIGKLQDLHYLWTQFRSNRQLVAHENLEIEKAINEAIAAQTQSSSN